MTRLSRFLLGEAATVAEQAVRERDAAKLRLAAVVEVLAPFETVPPGRPIDHAIRAACQIARGDI